MSDHESELHTWRPDSERRPVVQPFMPPVDKNQELRPSPSPPGSSSDRPRNRACVQDSSSSDGGDDAHVADYLRVLSKRRWTAASTFLIVLGLLATALLLFLLWGAFIMLCCIIDFGRAPTRDATSSPPA